MAEIWLALLLVFTLGSVGPATSATIADLETAMSAIKTKCQNDKCGTEADSVDSASGLDAKCLASLSFIECVVTETDCSTVTDDEMKALKDACKGILLYDFESALTAIKATCPSDKCDSAGVDGASGLDDKCLASQDYLTCLTDGTSCTTSVPDDDLEALKTPCKVTNVKNAWTTIATTFANDLPKCDSACPSSEVTNEVATATDDTHLNPLCQKIIAYSDCVQNTCTTPFGATELGELEDQCKTVITTTTETTITTGTTTVALVRTTVDPLVAFDSALTVIDGKCSAECNSTVVENASGLKDKCEESKKYIDCLDKSCTAVTSDELEALKEPCKDGCSILQVSTLVLMLSLLLSVI